MAVPFNFFIDSSAKYATIKLHLVLKVVTVSTEVMSGTVVKGSTCMTAKNDTYLTAQEISKKYKVAYPTINHYTDLGFLSIIKREGNKRLYDGRQVKKRLGLIAKLVNEGYPLRLIRKKILSNGKGRAV